MASNVKCVEDTSLYGRQQAQDIVGSVAHTEYRLGTTCHIVQEKRIGQTIIHVQIAERKAAKLIVIVADAVEE